MSDLKISEQMRALADNFYPPREGSTHWEGCDDGDHCGCTLRRLAGQVEALEAAKTTAEDYCERNWREANRLGVEVENKDHEIAELRAAIRVLNENNEKLQQERDRLRGALRLWGVVWADHVHFYGCMGDEEIEEAKDSAAAALRSATEQVEGS